MSEYLQKKNLAQGMMDLALLSANTNQLRYVLDAGDHHSYYLTNLILIITSLFLQIAVGLCLIKNSWYNYKSRKELASANRMSNFSVVGIFLITIINVFVSTFGGSTFGESSQKEIIVETTTSEILTTASEILTTLEN